LGICSLRLLDEVRGRERMGFGGWWFVYIRNQREPDWTGLLLMQWTVFLKALHFDTYTYLPLFLFCVSHSRARNRNLLGVSHYLTCILTSDNRLNDQNVSVGHFFRHGVACKTTASSERHGVTPPSAQPRPRVFFVVLAWCLGGCGVQF
jgi:hypothetical protein